MSLLVAGGEVASLWFVSLLVFHCWLLVMSLWVFCLLIVGFKLVGCEFVGCAFFTAGCKCMGCDVVGCSLRIVGLWAVSLSMQVASV